MRKQDRMANQKQSRPQTDDQSRNQDLPEKGQEKEQIKGGATPVQSARPPRQPGKLPLPD